MMGDVIDSTKRVRTPFIPFAEKQITINRFDAAYNIVVYFYDVNNVCLVSTYLMNKNQYYTTYPQTVNVPPPTKFIKIDIGRVDGAALAPNALTGKEFKVEKGNIATDWSPSAKDISSNIAAVTSYVDGAFRDGVIDETEKSSIKKYLNQINTDWESVYNLYLTINGNTYLTGGQKTALESAYPLASTAKNNLITSINTAIDDNAITEQEKADVDDKFSIYSAASALLQKRIQEGADCINAAVAQEKVNAGIVAATYWSVKSTSSVIYKDAINSATSGTHTSVTVSGEQRSGKTTVSGGFLTVTPNGGTEGTATASPKTISPANTDGKTSYTIKLYDDADLTKATLLDTITIPVVFKGASGVNAINIALDNEADLLPADANGGNVDYTGSGTNIRVFEGATELDYDGTGTANGKYNVTASATNITAGAKYESGLQCVFGNASAMAASDKATIAFTVSGKTLAGESFSIVKVQTITKSKTGSKGDKGNDGTSVSIKGSVATSTSLPSTGNTEGDGYITSDTGHLWIWTGAQWTDAGQIKGDSGQTAYLHMAYATNSNGTTGFSTTNATGATYIGTYSDFTLEDSTDPSKYKWLLSKGETGATLYTWIKYATDINGSGLSDSPDGMAYIGLAYNKTTAIESTTASDYLWSLIKGTDGIDGLDGTNGVTTYTWIKYSDNADGTGLYDTPTASTLYIGITTNKTTSTESTVKTDYVWSKFKGDQGIKGADGRSITLVDVEFAQSTSATVAPTTGWQTTSQAWVDGQYIWTRTKTTYSTGDPTYSNPINTTGSKGTTGSIGQGVDSVTEQYHISSSKTEQPAEASTGWSTTQPTWSQGMYIWSRVKVVYKNPSSTVYMGYAVSSEWEAVNDIQIGGRNLIKKSSASQSIAITEGKSGWGGILSEAKQAFSFSNLILKQNQNYVISFVAWSVNQTYALHSDLYPDTLPEKTFEITSVPTKFSWVINSASTDILNCSLRFFGEDLMYYDVYITDVQLEEGNKATDYTPAPEDVEAKIDEVYSRIAGRNLIDNSASRVQIAPAGDFYSYIDLCTLERNTTYTLSLRSLLQAGTATQYTVNIFSFSSSVGLKSTLLTIDSVNRQKFTFTTPNTDVVYNILLYAGVAGSTAGNTLQFLDIKLEEGAIASYYTPSANDVLAQISSLPYVQAAVAGSTNIKGGLVLSNLILLKNLLGEVSSGISGVTEDANPDVNKLGIWTGGTIEEAIAQLAMNQLNQDGSGQLAGGKINWDKFGDLTVSALYRTAASGARVEINPVENSIIIYNSDNTPKVKISPNPVKTIAELNLLQDSKLTAQYQDATTTPSNGQVLRTLNEIITCAAGYLYTIVTPQLVYDFNATYEGLNYYIQVVAYLVNNDTLDEIELEVHESYLYENNQTVYEHATISARTFNDMVPGHYSIKIKAYCGSPANGTASIYPVPAQPFRCFGYMQYSEMGLDGINLINAGNKLLHFGPDGLANNGEQNISGVLAAGRITAAGAQDGDKRWGAKADYVNNATRVSAGYYKVPVVMSNDDYTINISPRAARRTFYLGDQKTTYFEVYFHVESTLTDTPFDFQIFGNNA